MTDLTSGIYTITNLVNGMCYVGSTKNFQRRKADHFTSLAKNKHKNPKLQLAFNKYGVENFQFQIIEQLGYVKEWIIERENHYIVRFDSKKNGYNIGDASFGDTLSNHPNRAEILQQIGSSLRKRYASLTDEQWDKRFTNHRGERNGMFGKNHASSSKQKMSIAHLANSEGLSLRFKGKPKSKEHCRKISDHAKTRTGEKNSFWNRKHKKESIEKMAAAHRGVEPPNKMVIEIKGIRYRGYGEASRTLGIHLTTIRHRCLSKNPRFKEYIVIGLASEVIV